MTDLSLGDAAPKFTLQADGDDTLSLSDFKGKNVILYFYPKDDTPGCTKEAIGFSEIIEELSALNAVVLGVSKDTVTKHDKFIAKHNLKVRLLSDPENEMIADYGVWVEKNMYGRKYMGIERATFLIDGKGKIAEIWRKVRVKGHVEAVRARLEAL